MCDGARIYPRLLSSARVLGSLSAKVNKFLPCVSIYCVQAAAAELFGFFLLLETAAVVYSIDSQREPSCCHGEGSGAELPHTHTERLS